MSDTRRIELIAIDEIITWVLQQGLYGTHFEPLLVQMCERLVNAGVPLSRVNFSMRTLHPEIGAFAYRWKRVSGIQREEYQRNTVYNVDYGWGASPLKALMESDSFELRHRLMPENRPFPFPMFEELVEQGATDYFATQVVFEPNVTAQSGDTPPTSGMMISWTADGPEGFSDADLDAIRRLLPAIALALKSNGMAQMADDLLAAYLGEDAARRVISGAVSRGSLDKIKTAILYFDLQGFTKLSEALEPEILIDMLNAYFGAVVDIVHAHDGNVLKFMGDGLLAMFSELGDGQSRLAAIDAITAIREEVARLNAEREQEGLPVTSFSAAIHAGEVLYGNIGAPSRLDFTVIGPAVNAASRILGMCSALDQQILISSLVAQPVLQDRPALVSVGQYRLRGVRDRQELYTLD
ncbi:adenylate/guanylate cyclase domain-containing protein [Aestuariivita boseongensis]|uniref:adenylate/guanylate cyclase domain-containing protein n=1 Tax=Aestuariivita boseongensis TaxID=1470562 RepID=UPI0006802621|nr:adenylate/guanylate cyclase domain-containing protein [Aestuariivita boseongensis]